MWQAREISLAIGSFIAAVAVLNFILQPTDHCTITITATASSLNGRSCHLLPPSTVRALAESLVRLRN